MEGRMKLVFLCACAVILVACISIFAAGSEAGRSEEEAVAYRQEMAGLIGRIKEYGASRRGSDFFMIANGGAGLMEPNELLPEADYGRLLQRLDGVMAESVNFGWDMEMDKAMPSEEQDNYRRLLDNARRAGVVPLVLDYAREPGNVQRAYREDRSLGYLVDGYVAGTRHLKDVPCLGGYEQLEDIVDTRKPDEVVVAVGGEGYDLIGRVIQICEKTGTKVSLVPYYAAYMPSNPEIDNINGLPVINLRRIPLDNMGNAFVKRAMDIVGALALIILTSPLMLAAAVGVKLSSPGPVLFKQERVGKDKKTFYMYKFRSMRVNSEEKTGWSRNSDPRKTRFGALIRKFSIDELPQFFNVLKGDMSLVGPRPEVPHYVEQFKEEIPRYMVKHQVRPGITGWAQVNGYRGDTSIRKRIEYDIYYIENWNVFFDLKILLMTPFKSVNQEKLVSR